MTVLEQTSTYEGGRPYSDTRPWPPRYIYALPQTSIMSMYIAHCCRWVGCSICMSSHHPAMPSAAQETAQDSARGLKRYNAGSLKFSCFIRATALILALHNHDFFCNSTPSVLLQLLGCFQQSIHLLPEALQLCALCCQHSLILLLLLQQLHHNWWL